MTQRPNERLGAVIFDMDGVLLDTERMAMKCCMEAAHELGLVIPEELFLRVVGRDIGVTESIFREALGPDFPFLTFQQAWKRRNDNRLSLDGVPKKAGSEALLTMLSGRKVPLALATSTHRSEALDRMEAARLLDHFDVTVFGDEITNGKPAPDIFLRASQKLDVKPERCWVLEDSEPGLRAAHAAGMMTILVPDLVPLSASVEDMADQVVQSLSEAQIVIESLLT